MIDKRKYDRLRKEEKSKKIDPIPNQLNIKLRNGFSLIDRSHILKNKLENLLPGYEIVVNPYSDSPVTVKYGNHIWKMHKGGDMLMCSYLCQAYEVSATIQLEEIV